jgi:hypothetical protein
MANSKSSLVQVAQAVLDETFQAIKIVNADPSSGGATEITAQEILTAVESIDAKTPAAPATAGNQTSTNNKLDTLISQTDGVEASLSSIDTKTPALVSGRQPVDGSGVTQPISAVALPLPSGASTETTLSSIDTKTPALGQALAVASVPVVLTAAQIATLTPQTDALTDTQLRATAVPVSVSSSALPTGAATEATLSSLNAKVTAVNTGAVVVSSSALPSGAATETTLAGIRTRQDVVDFGATTTAQRVAANLGVAGVAVSASNPVPVSRLGTAAIQLVSSSQRPYIIDMASVNISTSYTQVIASTGSAINSIQVQNQGAVPILIAVGAAASEVVYYIAAAGHDSSQVALNIPSGSRIAIRSQTGTITANYFILQTFG